MRKSIAVLTVSSTILTIFCLWTGIFHAKTLDLQTLSIPFHWAILKRCLHHDRHSFLRANHPGIHLIGRWTYNPNTLEYLAAFPGSSIDFTIYNSTSLYIALGSSSVDLNLPVQRLHAGPYAYLKPQDTKTENECIGILISVGSAIQLFNYHKSGILRIPLGSASNRTTKIAFTLVESLPTCPGVLRLKGVWLSKGGRIIAIPSHQSEPLTASNSQYEADDLYTHLLADERSSSFQTVVEIITQASSIVGQPESPAANEFEEGVNFVDLLEQNRSLETRVVSVPVPIDICLTAQCNSSLHKRPQATTIQDLYFRSGPLDTPLYHHPWCWSSSTNPPSTLIFNVGLADYHHFITNAQNTHTLTKHSLDKFTSTFTTSFIDFILTIRRTTWHRHSPAEDTTHAYNSAPPDLTLLIMIPPLPPTANPVLTVALRNALSYIVTTLRTTHGDTHTHLIDTTGWLDTDDFHPISQLYFPNAAGHRKIAHFLSLHLCPHLSPPPGDCAFDKHDRYTGDVVVPGEMAVDRALHERKIERIKALVGGFDDRLKLNEMW